MTAAAVARRESSAFASWWAKLAAAPTDGATGRGEQSRQTSSGASASKTAASE